MSAIPAVPQRGEDVTNDETVTSARKTAVSDQTCGLSQTRSHYGSRGTWARLVPCMCRVL